MTRGELDALYAVLDKHRNKKSARAVKLLVWTGARRTEVLGARWGEFALDGDIPIWTRPAKRLKQRQVSILPLSAGVVDLLRTMKAETETRGAAGRDDYLFPSGDSQIADIEHFWKSIRTKIKRPDLHLHDLRHVFASALINSGVAIETITPLLGHKRSRITERYAHTRDPLLRAATNRAMVALAPSGTARTLPA